MRHVLTSVLTIICPLQEMQNEGCMPSLVTYNILIDMYGKAGRYEDAINVLGTMESNNIDPEVLITNPTWGFQDNCDAWS